MECEAEETCCTSWRKSLPDVVTARWSVGKRRLLGVIVKSPLENGQKSDMIQNRLRAKVFLLQCDRVIW